MNQLSQAGAHSYLDQRSKQPNVILLRYMIGSTLGTVLCCSRKAKDGKDVLLNRYKAHHGPVRSLQRNPLFPKNFMTAGDWSMKIWSEDITSSPLQWVWSGNRCSFFQSPWCQMSNKVSIKSPLPCGVLPDLLSYSLRGRMDT